MISLGATQESRFRIAIRRLAAVGSMVEWAIKDNAEKVFGVKYSILQTAVEQCDSSQQIGGQTYAVAIEFCIVLFTFM